MATPITNALEVEVTHHDWRYSWPPVLLVLLLLVINRTHIPDNVSIVLGSAVLVANIVLYKRRTRHMGWQTLHFTQDGVALGDGHLRMTRAKLSGWCRDPDGARLWSQRHLLVLRARPGEDRQLAAMLLTVFGTPVVLVARGTKTARRVAAAFAVAGAIIFAFSLFKHSPLPTFLGIGTFFIGLLAFLLLSTHRTSRARG